MIRESLPPVLGGVGLSTSHLQVLEIVCYMNWYWERLRRDDCSMTPTGTMHVTMDQHSREPDPERRHDASVPDFRAVSVVSWQRRCVMGVAVPSCFNGSISRGLMTSAARTVSGYRKRHNWGLTKVDMTFSDERRGIHSISSEDVDDLSTGIPWPGSGRLRCNSAIHRRFAC